MKKSDFHLFSFFFECTSLKGLAQFLFDITFLAINENTIVWYTRDHAYVETTPALRCDPPTKIWILMSLIIVDKGTVSNMPLRSIKNHVRDNQNIGLETHFHEPRSSGCWGFSGQRSTEMAPKICRGKIFLKRIKSGSFMFLIVLVWA